MDHLYRMGHRRIGVVTGPPLSFVSAERLRGATARAKSARLFKELLVVHDDFSVESGVMGGERLLADATPPTAIKPTQTAVDRL